MSAWVSCIGVPDNNACNDGPKRRSRSKQTHAAIVFNHTYCRACTKHLILHILDILTHAIRNQSVSRTFHSNVTSKALTACTAPNADRRILGDAASARSSQLWSTSPATSRAYQWNWSDPREQMKGLHQPHWGLVCVVLVYKSFLLQSSLTYAQMCSSGPWWHSRQLHGF